MQRNADVELGRQAQCEPGGKQRVAAQGKEVIVDAEAVVAEQVRPDRCDGVLGGGGRRRDGGAEGVVVGGGGGAQGLAVELAAEGEREAVGVTVAGGDGGGGQALADPGPDRPWVGGGALGRDEMGGQPEAGRGAERGHRGRRDVWVGTEHGLDFLGFDPLAEDLDLVVVAAVVFQQPVTRIAGQVAGAVHAAAWRAVGVGDEHVGGLGGLAEVAVANPGSGDAHLAGRARRHGPLLVVQDADGGVAVGAADDAGPGYSARSI